ncbi:LLM class flavin-dependent oxidoreductase [Paenibacillus beijingensis]|uniref:Luciferase-like domain-containing protein n=1 Tax=Paenibacillus beijingensis TaxID=1126833 RepID=A0A0D5NPC4_9BACL|nr:LLM class flavin-dependent oxidoreductase [Paenibacillus beijingensis]AJY77030.1 hypothetical protein VN24_23865 [Paenibacillus beijingensis]
MLTLSVLDQSPVPEGKTASEALAYTTKLAQETEKLGFRRFWVSEHHASNALAGSSPEVLIAHLAANTKHIRIGSGGVMLPHYSAYKVAENFRLLEALHPGRIDLGLGRAPGGMPLSTRALQEGKTRSVDRYPDQISDLTDYLHGTPGGHHPFAGLKASPVVDTAPQLWLLGSSGDSAVIAALQGASFAFAHFINPYGGEEAMKYYKEHFRSSVWNEHPNGIVAAFVICAETDEEAVRLSRSFDLSFHLLERGKEWPGFPSVQSAEAYSFNEFDMERIRHNRQRLIVGSPETVKRKLLALQDAYETDELMIVTLAHDFEARLNSYRLLAEAFQLEPTA